MIERYMLWSCVCLSACVQQARILLKRLNADSFSRVKHTSFLLLILACTVREFAYIQNNGSRQYSKFSCLPSCFVNYVRLTTVSVLSHWSFTLVHCTMDATHSSARFAETCQFIYPRIPTGGSGLQWTNKANECWTARLRRLESYLQCTYLSVLAASTATSIKHRVVSVHPPVRPALTASRKHDTL